MKGIAMQFKNFAVLVMLLISSILPAYVKDGVWQVHRAVHPPVIDGEMDDIYKTASTERVVRINEDDAALPDSYLDLFAEARLMWDETHLYVFVKVVDDEISCSSQNSYENDSVEYFFDGDNSKTTEALDGMDDVMVRIEYCESDYIDGPWLEEMEYGVADWENPAGDASGYSIEAAFPLDDIYIDAESGHVFGFELQINDRDHEARENMARWWGNSNDAWHWAHLWGTAELNDYTADEVMGMMCHCDRPEIDGVMDEVWNDMAAIESATQIFYTEDVEDGSFTEITDWKDIQMEFRGLWHPDGFFLWAEVIDDEINVSGAEAFENDGIELYFDGDNAKGQTNDDNDVQYRWVWGEESGGTENSVVAWGTLTDPPGYTFELMIPTEDLVFEHWTEFGFEIQCNDRDHDMRENSLRWWGSDHMAWLNPYRFGTAELIGVCDCEDPYSGVEASDNQPEKFSLSQNTPNPFNPATTIRYALPEMSDVRLYVYDLSGREVAQLQDGVQTAGTHTVVFDGTRLSSGVYFCRLETAAGVWTRKMLLMK